MIISFFFFFGFLVYSRTASLDNGYWNLEGYNPSVSGKKDMNSGLWCSSAGNVGRVPETRCFMYSLLLLCMLNVYVQCCQNNYQWNFSFAQMFFHVIICLSWTNEMREKAIVLRKQYTVYTIYFLPAWCHLLH